MTQNEFLGSLLLALVPILTTIGLFAKASWNLSSSITELRETIKNIADDFKYHDKKIEEHDVKIHQHDIRIYGIETKIEDHLQ